ncbi:MAG: hypothetical protein K1X57_15870 [Gemmataceae bacterium]|nr:hypothetical protein [Gemmataceae bacterium]
MSLLGTMFTTTTYGTWLRGDRRGWIDDGRLMPPNPALEDADRARLKHPMYLFPPDELLQVGTMIGNSITSRLGLPIYALTVQTWHIHLLTGPGPHTPADIMKCAEEAVRYGLKPGRPIWTADYDKRYCFDETALHNRINYIERHNLAAGWPAQPWPFLTR